MNDTRNRDKPARELTKREEAALRVLEAMLNRPGGDAHDVDEWAFAAGATADALFDRLDHLPELAHAYDEPDFDHDGTP